MNRSTFALFIALLIHLLFFLLFLLFSMMIPAFEKKDTQEEKRIKVSLKELPKKKENSQIKQEQKKTIEAPAMPKGKQLKEIVKKSNTDISKTKLKPVQKTVKTKKTEPIAPIKPYIPLLDKNDIDTIKPEIKEEPKHTGAFAWMYEDKSEEEKKKKSKKIAESNNNINQDIKELYGMEFGKLSRAQQEYILDNQEIMRRITQQVLNRVASVNIKSNINVNTDNVIEFYLHPNGNMSDFRFLKKSGYFILDDTTKETIEYAYAKYPRPKEKTLIRYNVFYNLRY